LQFVATNAMFADGRKDGRMRQIEKLTALFCAKVTAPGFYNDGQGLNFKVDHATAKRWIFRSKEGGKGRDHGLGPWPDVALGEARQKAHACRALRREGQDPIAVHKAAKAAAKAASAKAMTFKECHIAYTAAHEGKWSSRKHARQWRMTVETYAYPVLGSLPVAAIDTALVMKVLQPLWATRIVTASRLRQRIEAILGWATVSGLRSGDNPARWANHLDHLLAAPSDVRVVAHHVALDYHKIGDFVASLRRDESISALALEFLILTAARSGEVFGARWSEIDCSAATWTVPEGRMKSRREHRAVLSTAALAVLDRAKAYRRGDDLIFPATRGGILASATVRGTMARLGHSSETPHGFRATFRTWAGETTAYAREVIEIALAHAVGDQTERAYTRGDLLERRRRLMQDWATFCGRPSVERSAAVAPIRA
jgi:integrase